MPDHHLLTPFAPVIPSSTEVRQRLAVVSAEADLLRGLLRLAQRKERETQRLARAISPCLANEAAADGQ
jgi:hypothetical protein